MRVLVAGGRDFDDRAWLHGSLDKLHHGPRGPITCIIEGGARGADSLGAEWALINDVPKETYEADWGSYGKGAGPKRNGEMLVEGRPDLVVLAPGGRGTANMEQQSRTAGYPVMKI